jgi:hypothetical protein
MKAILILIYAVVLFISIIKVIFGYQLWWLVIILAVISFAFIDWEKLPWLKLRFKSE